MKKNRWMYMIVLSVLMMLMTAGTVFATEKQQFDTPESVRWTDTTVARWKKVDKATHYEVQLYEGDEYVRTIRDIAGTKVDLVKYMKDGRDYYFSVRAVPTTSQKKKYVASEWAESEYLNSTEIGDVSGRWRDLKDGRKYRTGEGDYVASQWHFIGGNWYYFNESGYMQTGWQKLGDLWYYLGTDGVMQTGWKQIENIWYYLKSDGSMAVGWLEAQPGQWYYLNADGSMAVNTVIEGRQIDASGLAH